MGTLTVGQSANEVLEIDRQLTLTVASVGTVCVQRKRADTILETVNLVASQVYTFGEYLQEMHFAITCNTGSVTYVTAHNTGKNPGRATQTNDDAATGAIGEYLETTVAVGSAVSETTATPVDVATLALTAGDWEVSGTINRVLTGTTASVYAGAISPTANTVPAQAGGSGVGADSVVIQDATFGTAVSGNFITSIPSVRVKLAASATIHLVAADTFSLGTIDVFGTIRARRVR